MALALIVVVTLGPITEMHWPVAGLVSHRLITTGNATLPVSADAVMPALAPTFTVATPNTPIPLVPGIFTIPGSGGSVAANATMSGTGVAEAESRSVFSPTLVGAGSLSEGLLVAGGVVGVFYVAACTGSVLVATLDLASDWYYHSDSGERLATAIRRSRTGMAFRMGPTAFSRVLDGWSEHRARYLSQNPIGRVERSLDVLRRGPGTVQLLGAPNPRVPF